MSSNHIWGSYKNFANLASLSATVFSLRLTCEKETFLKLEVSRLYSSIIWPKATKQGEFETRCLSIISESPSKTTSCSPSSMEKEMALSYMPKLPHPPPWVVKAMHSDNAAITIPSESCTTTPRPVDPESWKIAPSLLTLYWFGEGGSQWVGWTTIRYCTGLS